MRTVDPTKISRVCFEAYIRQINFVVITKVNLQIPKCCRPWIILSHDEIDESVEDILPWGFTRMNPTAHINVFLSLEQEWALGRVTALRTGAVRSISFGTIWE